MEKCSVRWVVGEGRRCRWMDECCALLFGEGRRLCVYIVGKENASSSYLLTGVRTLLQVWDQWAGRKVTAGFRLTYIQPAHLLLLYQVLLFYAVNSCFLTFNVRTDRRHGRQFTHHACTQLFTIVLIQESNLISVFIAFGLTWHRILKVHDAG